MRTPSLRWTGAAFATCVALTLLLWATRGWLWLGVPPVNSERTPFSDTEIHLAAAVNCADGLGQWYGRVCFLPDIDATPRSQTYEPWLTLHRLGLNSMADVYGSAVVIIVLFYLAMCAAFRPSTPGGMALVLALLFTPAVQLGVERGNFDLLIAALLCIAGAMLARERMAGAATGIALLSLATMLKLYTGLACALAWLAARIPWRWSMPVSIVGVVVAIAVVGPRELLVLGRGAPEGETRFSTGARWLFEQVGTGAGVTAVCMAVCAVVLVWLALRQEQERAFIRWPRRTALFQVAFLTAVPLFLLKNSYDYRFVLWLPCLALPFAWLHSATAQPRLHRLAVMMMVLFFVATGAELPLSWLDHWRESGWARVVSTALIFAKQLAAWLLAASFIAVFVRSLSISLAGTFAAMPAAARRR